MRNSAAAVLLGTLTLAAAPAAADDRCDYHTGWGQFREAVVADVASAVAALGDPDTSPEALAVLTELVEVRFERHRTKWRVSPPKAWAALTSTGSTPAALSSSRRPLDFDDHLAFAAAIEAEVKALLAELDQPWFLEPSELRPHYLELIRLRREMYQNMWSVSRLEAWFKLDQNRLLRAFEETRRREAHERQRRGERAALNDFVPAGTALKLRDVPGGTKVVGHFDHQALYDVVEKRGNWVRVRGPSVLGWAHRYFLDVASAPASPTTGKTGLSDRLPQ